MKSAEIKRDTHKIDATQRALGRVASEVAHHLIGKHKVNFAPNVDAGDYVEVENISKVTFSGKKEEQKIYHRHTGYPGGIRIKKMSDLIKDNPAEILKIAVSRMLPKNKHRTERLKRLKIS